MDITFKNLLRNCRLHSRQNIFRNIFGQTVIFKVARYSNLISKLRKTFDILKNLQISLLDLEKEMKIKELLDSFQKIFSKRTGIINTVKHKMMYKNEGLS